MIRLGTHNTPIKKPQTAEMNKAIQDYDRALAQARSTFDKSAEQARKKLLVALGAAQEKAAKANELDEAVRIRDIRKEYEDGVRFASKGGKLQIISAFYGQNISWLDVTEKIQQATRGRNHWSTTVNTESLGEPAPGFSGPRTLLIHYLAGRKLLIKAVYEGGELTLP